MKSSMKKYSEIKLMGFICISNRNGKLVKFHLSDFLPEVLKQNKITSKGSLKFSLSGKEILFLVSFSKKTDQFIFHVSVFFPTKSII